MTSWFGFPEYIFCSEGDIFFTYLDWGPGMVKCVGPTRCLMRPCVFKCFYFPNVFIVFDVISCFLSRLYICTTLHHNRWKSRVTSSNYRRSVLDRPPPPPGAPTPTNSGCRCRTWRHRRSAPGTATRWSPRRLRWRAVSPRSRGPSTPDRVTSANTDHVVVVRGCCAQAAELLGPGPVHFLSPWAVAISGPPTLEPNFKHCILP